MGKKSLLQPTSGKGSGSGKKATQKKAAPKKATAKKSGAAAKAAPKGKKAKAPKKAPAKAVKKAPAAKKAAQPKKAAAPTRSELLRKRFDMSEPPAAWKPDTPQAPAGAYDAPSFFAGMSEDDTQRAKSLLMAKFDYAAIQAAGQAAAKKAKAAPKPKAKPPSREELIRKRFETSEPPAAWKPDTPQAPAGAYDAPSFFAGMSEEDTQRAKSLLMAKFDYAAIQAAGEAYAKKLAEKAAAEKAAAEKAAAEKAAAEKAAAEKAAAEKAAAKEKADAKRAALEAAQKHPTVTVKPEKQESGMNPIKIGAAALAAVFLMLLVYSYANTRKYYIEEKDGAIEISRGIFAPMGTSRQIVLTGVAGPEVAKDTYTWEEAYALMYDYYIKEADAVLEGPGTPDTSRLQQNLELAAKFAPDRQRMEEAKGRLASLDLQIEVQKATAAFHRRTIESVEKGIAILSAALAGNISDAEAAMVERQIAAGEVLLAELEAEQADAEALAAQEAAAEEAAAEPDQGAEAAAPGEGESTGH